MLYQACSRLELMQLYTSWREGEAQGSSDAYSYTGIACPDMKKVSQFCAIWLGFRSKSRKIIFKLSFHSYIEVECNGG